MRIYLLERESDIKEVEMAIEDINIILDHIKSENYDTEWNEGWLLIPINGNKIKLKHIKIKFYLAINNSVEKGKGLALDNHFNVIIYLYGLDLKKIHQNLPRILSQFKNDIIHEFQHIIDHFKTKGHIMKNYINSKDDLKGYLNHPSEISATYKQALALMIETINESFKEHVKLLDDPEMLEVYDKDLFLNDILYMRSPEVFIRGVIDRIIWTRKKSATTDYNLDSIQLKKIKKRAYQVYQILKEKFLKFFMEKKANENIS